MQLQFLFIKGNKAHINFQVSYSLSWLLFFFLFLSCKTLQPPETIDVVVKNIHTDKPVEAAKVELYLSGNYKNELTTDKLGYVHFNLMKYAKSKKVLKDTIDDFLLKWKAPKTGLDSSLVPVVDSIQLNQYIHFYGLFLDGDTAAVSQRDTNKVADMHFHLSQKMHNLYGYELYKDSNKQIPVELDWYRDYRKLDVLCNTGNMLCHWMDSVNRKEELAALISQKWLYSKGGSNKLTQYSQATLPHMNEGGVFLAFNAISPWEYKLCRDPRSRTANHLFVSGADYKWLKMIGQRNHSTLTHWQNFNNEYKMIVKQSNRFNHYDWRFFDFGDDLKKDSATVINVVEGSHMLQDTLFPHSFSYHDFRSRKAITKYFVDRVKVYVEEQIDTIDNHDRDFWWNSLYHVRKTPIFMRLDSIFKRPDSTKLLKPWKLVTYLQINLPYDSLGIKIIEEINNTEDIDTFKLLEKVDMENVMDKVMEITDFDTLEQFVRRFWLKEVTTNIDSLKRLKGPPICMMNIGHLVYNGMVGHAPNLDQGNWLSHIAAKKNYDIRVSDDDSYTRQWEKTFYVVPGVNKIGRVVIDSLLSWTNGYRIYVDLKHSDVSTRKYFFDSVMVKRDALGKLDTIPPICSHCAMTGLPIQYYSPFANEYTLVEANFTQSFYPFSINLYDDEITKICKHNGIIGIVLEQRSLGGYLNKRRTYDYFIKKNGKEVNYSKKQLLRRWPMTKRWLTHYKINNHPAIDSAYNYTKYRMGVAEKTKGNEVKKIKPVMAALYRDYKSVEPFLYNVFRVIDHSGLTPSEAWKHVCLGSDFDGMTDPMDICPTASQYPLLKERVKQFIPVFLLIRSEMDREHKYEEKYRTFCDYFPGGPENPKNEQLNAAVNSLFYYSLRDFAAKYFKRTKYEILDPIFTNPPTF